MLVINCKIYLILTWPENRVIASSTAAYQVQHL